MKLKRQLAAVGGTLALVAGAASVALIGGATSSSAVESPSSAYGLAATGLVPIAATPAVTSATGKKVTGSLIGLPSNPLISGGIVNALAQNDHAEADVANLAVGNGLISQYGSQLSQLTSQLGPVCTALSQVPTGQLNGAIGSATSALGLQGVISQVQAGTGINLTAVTALDLSQLAPEDLGGICDVLAGDAGLVGASAITTQCHKDTGSVNIANLKALGLPVSIDTTKPDQKVSIPGVLTIITDQQTRNANGTFTVNGLVIDLQLVNAAEIVVTSATCGHISHRTSPGEHPSNAPTPTPVHTKAPVTG